MSEKQFWKTMFWLSIVTQILLLFQATAKADITPQQGLYLREVSRCWLTNGNFQQYALGRPDEGKAGYYCKGNTRRRPPECVVTIMEQVNILADAWVNK
jgi:hypothetical protein